MVNGYLRKGHYSKKGDCQRKYVILVQCWRDTSSEIQFGLTCIISAIQFHGLEYLDPGGG